MRIIAIALITFAPTCWHLPWLVANVYISWSIKYHTIKIVCWSSRTVLAEFQCCSTVLPPVPSHLLTQAFWTENIPHIPSCIAHRYSKLSSTDRKVSLTTLKIFAQCCTVLQQEHHLQKQILGFKETFSVPQFNIFLHVANCNSLSYCDALYIVYYEIWGLRSVRSNIILF